MAKSAEGVKSPTDIHAIYNRHVSEKDAQRTLEIIPAESVVYVEAMNLEVLPENDIRVLSIYLGRYLRSTGKDRDYKRAKKEIVDLYRNDDAVYEDKDFSYEDSIFSGLLKKDCQIIPADYSHRIDLDNQEDFDTVTSFLYNLYNFELLMGRGLLEYDNGKKYFDHLADLVDSRWQAVEIREESAVDIITQDMQDHDSNAFVIYGASHRDSLTARLRQQGFSVSPNDISNAEGLYVHAPYEEFQANMMRTIASTAFMATTWQIADIEEKTEAAEEADPPLSDMYNALEKLNGDEKSTLDFCTRCLSIQNGIVESYSESLRQYWKLVDNTIEG